MRTKKRFERGGGDRLVLHANAVGNRGVIAVLAVSVGGVEKNFTNQIKWQHKSNFRYKRINREKLRGKKRGREKNTRGRTSEREREQKK